MVILRLKRLVITFHRVGIIPPILTGAGAVAASGAVGLGSAGRAMPAISDPAERLHDVRQAGKPVPLGSVACRPFVE
jgi:hypothetical protein